MEGERAWCARCGGWARLALELRTAGVETGPAAHVREAHGPPQRRALRVPAGWRVEYHEWDEGALSNPELQQDLFLAVHDVRDRVLDLSWYYGDAEVGRYRLATWSRRAPEAEMIYVAEHADAAAAETDVERVLLQVASGR